MLTTLEIVDLLRDKTETRSDYAVAKLIGIRPQTISNWKTGRGHMGDTIALKAAKELGIDPDYILACVTAERAKGTPLFKTWAHICQRLTPPEMRASA